MKTILFVLFVFFASQTSSNILLPCNVDADCEAIVKDSTCSLVLGKHCTCPAGFTISSDVSSCIKEVSYGEKCEEAIQCSHMLTGAQCNGVCECADGLTYLKGRCRKLGDLNEPCTDEIDCVFGYNRESVECRDGKCQCAEGFYQRFTNVCRRESINGERCIVNADCEENSACTSNVCTSTVGTQTFSAISVAVQTSQSIESYSDGPVDKSRSFSTRSSFYKYHKLENSDTVWELSSADDDESTLFGESCELESAPCPGLNYSLCRRGFCQCQEGFYEQSGICKAELGEIVEGEGYCGSGTFKNNRCVCDNDQFYMPNMRMCIKSAIGINTSCTQPSQCTPYGAAFCPIAQPRRCTCHDYARYSEATEMCEMKTGVGEFCQQTTDCKTANTVCTTKNTCECKANFVAQNDAECKPGFDSECEVTEDCAFVNAECKVDVVDETVKKCKCQEEFVAVDNVCLRKASTYNDTCTDDEQCAPLLGDKASCIDSKCACDESLHLKNGKCNDKIELNGRCSKSAECFVGSDPESVECRNGVCQCRHDYTTDTNQNQCIRPRENKNSSNKTSPLKVVTLMLIASAVVITGSALKDAYYP